MPPSTLRRVRTPPSRSRVRQAFQEGPRSPDTRPPFPAARPPLRFRRPADFRSIARWNSAASGDPGRKRLRSFVVVMAELVGSVPALEVAGRAVLGLETSSPDKHSRVDGSKSPLQIRLETGGAPQRDARLLPFACGAVKRRTACRPCDEPPSSAPRFWLPPSSRTRPRRTPSSTSRTGRFPSTTGWSSSSPRITRCRWSSPTSPRRSARATKRTSAPASPTSSST